jgi:hypothetical protein
MGENLKILKGSKSKVRVREDLYQQLSQALLRVIPRHEDGVRLLDIPERLKGNLSSKLWKGLSLKWHIMVVKLDLEARKMIGRVPGSRPQRLRRLVTY